MSLFASTDGYVNTEAPGPLESRLATEEKVSLFGGASSEND